VKRLKSRVDKTLEVVAQLLYENRFKALIILFLFFAGFCSQIHKITINTTLRSYLKETDPVLQDWNYKLEQFGRDPLSICLAIETSDIFNIDFLKKLKSLSDEICLKVPHVEKVETLINARNIRGESDNLIVEELFENWPQTQKELNLIKERVRSNPIYRDTIVAQDEKFTTVLIKLNVYSAPGDKGDVFEGFGENLNNPVPTAHNNINSDKKYLTGEERKTAVNSTQSIVHKYDSVNFKIYMTGATTNSVFLQNAVMQDLQIFFLVSFTIISIFLYIIFRRISGVALPGLIVIFSLLSTLGVRSIFGDPLTVVSQLMPCFIIAVGVGYSIHILALFYRHLDITHDKKKSIMHAFGHSGLPIVITCITTAGGLLSFLTAELVPVMKFGIYASTGVVFALIYTLWLIPPMISIIPFKTDIKGKQEKVEGLWMDKLLAINGRFVVKHPNLILITAFLVILFSLVGIQKIRFGQDYVKWFPKDSVVRKGAETIDKNLCGSYVTTVILDFKEKDSLYEPSILNRIEGSLAYLENLKVGKVFVGKAWSVTTILKEINQALHENDGKYYTIPQDKNLVAQELFLYENSNPGDIENFVDRSFSKAQLAFKIPNLSLNENPCF